MFLPKNYLNYTKRVYIIFYLSSKNTLHIFYLHKCTKCKLIWGYLYIYQLFTVTEYRYSSSTHLTLKKIKPNSSPHTPTKKIIVKNFRTHPIFTLKTSIFQTLKLIYLSPTNIQNYLTLLNQHTQANTHIYVKFKHTPLSHNTPKYSPLNRTNKKNHNSR